MGSYAATLSLIVIDNTGNDFLPHLNTLDIGDGAFDLIFQTYKEQRSGWGKDSYLSNNGDIADPARLEAFLAAIGAVETEILEQREIDDAAYIKKKRRWNKRDGLAEGPSDLELKEAEDAKQNDYLTMMENLMANNKGATFVDGWKPVAPGEKDFKGRYYYEKMKMTPIDIQAHHDLRKAYIEGLMWCLAYYYRGCISWGWFYPYHYGPMLSDLVNLPKMFDEIKFELGAPLTPFQQLMGCLPPASSQLVPKPYRYLMTSPESPIIHFYPKDFEVDMNGKKNPWEGVNILPFIEVQLLRDSIDRFCPDSSLTPDERHRNTRGSVYCYTFDLTCTNTIDSPNKKIGLTDIVKCHSKVTVIDELDIHGVSFRPELIPGTKIPYPGFPSLNVLPIASVETTPIGLNCFGMPSKYPNTVLNLHQMPELPPIEDLAANVLGKSLYINYPMMHEAKVTAITNAECEIRMVKGKPKRRQFNKNEQERWSMDAELARQGYLSGIGVPGSGGVNIGEVKVRLKLLPLQGMKTNVSNGSTKKLFGKEEADVPLQLALWQAPAPDPRFVERGPVALEERFPISTNVVLTKGKHRGCSGEVVAVTEDKKVAVKVQVMPPETPFGLALARSVYESYVSSADASRVLKLHPGLFGKITGSLFIEPGKYDIGLNLKSSDGLCVSGYVRQKKESSSRFGSVEEEKKAWDSGDSVLVVGSSRTGANDSRSEERIQWEYTPKAIRLINEYRKKFPQLFQAITRFPNEKKYDANKLLGPNGAEWLPVIREWLNGVETAKLPRTPISTESMSKDAVVAVEKAANVRNLALTKKGFPKESLIKIPGSALYRENSTGATDVLQVGDNNNDEAPELGDRIVNLCATGIPFGARGTVIGIHQATTGCVEVVMDEEFVGGTSLQGACSNFRGKLCVWAHLLKISVDNSDGVVDSLVPQGAGRAAVDKILSHIQGEVSTSQEVLPEPSSGSNSSAPPTVTTPPRPRAASAGHTNRSSSSGKARAGSTGRGKQGVWREAVGPAEKGNGFKKAKKGKSGLAKWKAIMKGEPVPSSTKAKAPSSQGKEAQLKAMLGVAPETASQPNLPPAPKPATGDQEGALKAMLGLSISGSAPQQAPVQAAPTQPTAADKLLQLMSQNQSQPMSQSQPIASSFNFTYVEEGKDAAPPPLPPQQPHMMGYPPPPPPQMPMAFMGPGPGLGPMPVQYPGILPPQPPNGGGPMAMAMPPQFAQARRPPPQQANSSPSDVEFPPLGAEPPKAPAEAPAVPEAPKPKSSSSSMMVPSVLAKASKAKK